MAQGLSGLASGVDTGSVVDQLMQLERQKLNRYTLRQRAVTAEQTGLRDIQAKLKALAGAGAALKGQGVWGDVQSVTSSEPTRIEVTRPEGLVPPTAVTVKVSALASGAQTRFGAWTPPAAETRMWVADGVGVTLKAGATVQDAANAINATGKAVYAGIVEGKLVLTSRQTGAGAAVPELREGADWASGTALAAASTVAGANADITVNGVRDQSRATNDFWLADQGLHLRLKSVTTTDVTVTATPPAMDKAAIKDKLKAFVEAYNGLVTAVNAKTTEKRVANPATGTEAEKGALFGDSGLNGILAAVRRGIMNPVAGLDDPLTPAIAEPDELRDIGIAPAKGSAGATSADAKLGKLVIDDAKLDAALTDPLAVKALFSGRGAVAGLSADIQRLVDGYTGAGGALETRVKGADSRVRQIRDQVAEAEKRIEAKEKRYKAQFAAMEKAMGQAQSQSAWLAGQIAGLNAGR